MVSIYGAKAVFGAMHRAEAIGNCLVCGAPIIDVGEPMPRQTCDCVQPDCYLCKDEGTIEHDDETLYCRCPVGQDKRHEDDMEMADLIERGLI